MARVRGAMRIACLSKLSCINVGQVKSKLWGIEPTIKNKTGANLFLSYRFAPVLHRYAPLNAYFFETSQIITLILNISSDVSTTTEP